MVKRVLHIIREEQNTMESEGADADDEPVRQLPSRHHLRVFQRGELRCAAYHDQSVAAICPQLSSVIPKQPRRECLLPEPTCLLPPTAISLQGVARTHSRGPSLVTLLEGGGVAGDLGDSPWLGVAAVPACSNFPACFTSPASGLKCALSKQRRYIVTRAFIALDEAGSPLFLRADDPGNRRQDSASPHNKDSQREPRTSSVCSAKDLKDRDRGTKSIKHPVLDAVTELIDELEMVHVNISEQALEHIHSNEVILTFGMCKTVYRFLKEAAKKRKFQVVVAEGAPDFRGQQLARSLAEAGIMARVPSDTRPRATPLTPGDAIAIFAGTLEVLRSEGTGYPWGQPLRPLRQHRLCSLSSLHSLQPVRPVCPLVRPSVRTSRRIRTLPRPSDHGHHRRGCVRDDGASALRHRGGPRRARGRGHAGAGAGSRSASVSCRIVGIMRLTRSAQFRGFVSDHGLRLEKSILQVPRRPSLCSCPRAPSPQVGLNMVALAASRHAVPFVVGVPTSNIQFPSFDSLGTLRQGNSFPLRKLTRARETPRRAACL